MRRLASILVGFCAVLFISAQGCGGGSTGGGNCENTPCFRANQSVETCAGPIKYSGCCSCPQGTVDRLQLKCAPADAATDAMDCGMCFRPNECVKMCGDAVIYTGCCPCPMGSFDRITCPDDASSDAKSD